MLVLTVSYDGTDFAGSQIQPGARTVQGVLEAALGALAVSPPRATFASRTDRGVHAAAQVVGCADSRPGLAGEQVRRAINAHLPDDVAVVGVDRRDDAFHPRFEAHWREYRYRVWSGPEAPLGREFAWQRRQPLDLVAMNEAAACFVGRQDFAAVAGGGEGVPWSAARERVRGTVRTVSRCECGLLAPWWGPNVGTLIELRIVADGFLPRMVRNIVELVVDAGAGKLSVGEVRQIIANRDRRMAAGTAPAHGLTLWRVGYDEEGDRPV